MGYTCLSETSWSGVPGIVYVYYLSGALWCSIAMAMEGLGYIKVSGITTHLRLAILG